MRTLRLFPAGQMQFFNCPIPHLKLPSFFTTLSCFVLSFFLQFNAASAQVTPCTTCTANDVNVISVELVTPITHLSLPPTCTGSEQITGILKITVDQNATTRYGFRVFGDILVDGQYSSLFAYCDPSEFTSGTYTEIFVENAPITWTCGTKLELRNLFVGWGNSEGHNACTPLDACVLGPHCAQFPLNGEPPIVVVTPLSADFSATGSCPTGKTAQTYSFNALDATNGTTGGTPPYPSNAYSWSIANASAPGTEVATMNAISNPTFDFSTLGAGTYIVTLTVTDDNPTAVSSKSHNITVISCCTAFAGPALTVVNNCDGTSTITAKDASNVIIPPGELTWSNGGTGNPITVSTTTAVTATRTVSGCVSNASNSVTPAPKTAPAAPILSVVDNCNSTSTITAKDASDVVIPAVELTWSNGESGNPITVNTTTSVTATRTVNGCTSVASNSVTPAPKTTLAAPILSVVDNCDGTSTITAEDASDAVIPAGELTWSNGETGNPITVSTTTAVTATRTASGCVSDASNSVTPSPKTAPAAPVLSVVDNCNGTSTISAKDGSNVVIPAGELTWSNNSSGNPITVNTTTAVTATRTLNGCTSVASNSATPAPKTAPAAPVLSVVDNCNGTSTITAKDASNVIIPSGELTWSNSGSGNPITVNTTTAVTATRTVNGCTSVASNSVTPAPKTAPAAPVLSVVDNCNGTSTITAKDASNVIIPSGELTWSNSGSGNPITVNTTTAVTATRTVNGCTSVASNSVTPAPKTTLTAPVITSPICAGATSVSGTSTEANGTTIEVLKGATSLGTTTVSGGAWTKSGLAALATGDIITAKATATGKCPSVASGGVTVSVNVICPSYTGDLFANTSSTSTGGTAIIHLAYNIAGVAPCNSLSGLTAANFGISFSADPSNTGVVLSNKLYSAGILTADATVTLPSSAYSATIQVTLSINNSNFIINAACVEVPLVTVSTKVDGFVTGGGYIIPTSSGGSKGGSGVIGLKNNFGFNIKYNKSNTKLQGNWNTIIRRKEGTVIHNYQVKSSQAKSLVVYKISATSYRADFSFTGANLKDLTTGSAFGTGTVNVTVFDNGEPGSNVDQIFISIKDNSNALWYSSSTTANVVNTPANYPSIPKLTAGNIQIHTLGAAVAYSSNTEIYQRAVSTLSVSAYPNPVTDKVKFTIVSPVSGKATLDIYNVMGQKLHTVYQGYLFAGRGQVIDYNVPSTFKGSLIYTLKVGDKQVNGKVERIK